MKCKNCSYLKYDENIKEYVCNDGREEPVVLLDGGCNKLVLPIKKKWFDMILSGEKKEEYREIKPYYKSRFIKAFNMGSDDSIWKHFSPYEVLFRNGYSSTSPSFVARVSLKVDAGRTEWGAEPGVKYYCLCIEEIVTTYKCKVG